MLKDARLTASTVHPFDEAQVRSFIERDYDRTGGYLSATNHGQLMSKVSKRGPLPKICVPLLVTHGTADPVYPFEHGIALSKTVHGATLVRIEGGGHELHPADCNTIIGAVVAHTDTGERGHRRLSTHRRPGEMLPDRLLAE